MAKNRGETMLLVCNVVDMNEFATVLLPLILTHRLEHSCTPRALIELRR